MVAMTVTDICNEAVRRVERFGASQDGADDDQLAIALTAFNSLMGELVGTERLYGFVPEVLALTVLADTSSYILPAGPIIPDENDLTVDATNITADGAASFAGTDNSDIVDDRGIQFPIYAIAKLNGVRQGDHLKFLTRREFDELQDKAASGNPIALYFDYLDIGTPTLHTYRSPAVTGWTIELTYQTFTPDYRDRPDRIFPLRAAWEQWAKWALCVDLGSGGLNFRPDVEVNRWIKFRDDALTKLMAIEAREYVNLEDQKVAYQRNP